MTSSLIYRNVAKIAAAFAAAAISGSAGAHEFWITPSSFRPQVDSVLKLHFETGDGFPGEVVHRDDARIVVFSCFGPRSTKGSAGTAVVGRDGDSTAGLLRPAEPGTHVIAYRNTPKPITLEPGKFESYLREEGLDGIVAERARLGESDKPGRELFSRSAKLIFNAVPPGQASTPSSEARSEASRATTPVGLTLELTPAKDPSQIKPGDAPEFVLTYQGRPLPNALVLAHTPGQGSAVPSARTDESGKVSLKLPSHGMWLISAVHMTRAAPDSGAEWESVWASLTFEIGAPSAPPPPTAAVPPSSPRP